MFRAAITDVRVTDAELTVVLTDGRAISTPLTEFPELHAANSDQRSNWKITDAGTAIFWPDIDEEIGLAGILGVPETLVEETAAFTIHNPEPSRR